MTELPQPRLVVVERGRSVLLVMRRGLTEGHDRVLGELPAKLRPAFDVAATLARAGVPSDRWEEVASTGIALIARHPEHRGLLAARTQPAPSGAVRMASRPADVVGSPSNVGEPRSVEGADGAQHQEEVTP